MKWLYVPNENHTGMQVGPRIAFEKLYADNRLKEYHTYSYLVRQKELGQHAQAQADFLQTVERIQPDVIFIQRTTDRYPMDRDFLRKIKSVNSKPKLILYEEDPYGHIVKRLDKTMQAVVAESDMIFIGGTGYLLDLYRRAGATRMRFAPHSYDSMRFDTPWQPTRQRKWDAVMIGNLSCLKKIPFLFMPGGASRKKTAQHFYHFLGDRFALFGGGQGWNNAPYCQGKIAYEKQGDVIRDAWMSVNWGQFDEIGMYCSDRLPISLACGVPHITNYQPGYEHVYANIPGLFIVKSPREAADVAIYLLSLNIDTRIELGLQALDYARKKLHASVVYADIAAIVEETFFSGAIHGSSI